MVHGSLQGLLLLLVLFLLALLCLGLGHRAGDWLGRLGVEGSHFGRLGLGLRWRRLLRLQHKLSVAFVAARNEVGRHIGAQHLRVVLHFHGHLLVLRVRVARAFEATDLRELQLVGLAHVLGANRILFIAPDLEAARRLRLEFELAVRLHVLVLAALRPLVQVGVLQSAAAREFLLGHGRNEVRRLPVLSVRHARGGPGCRPNHAGVDHVVGVDSVVMVLVNRILVRTFW